MLKPTSLIMGAGLGLDVACLTDGRFSGGYGPVPFPFLAHLLTSSDIARTVSVSDTSFRKLKLVDPSHWSKMAMSSRSMPSRTVSNYTSLRRNWRNGERSGLHRL
jgi:hypothetical protein